jgi:hypothetical protein
MSSSSLKEGEQIRGSGASTAGGTIVSASTTSVSSILSSLSAGLFTTIVPREESGRAPEPFGTGFAHFALVSACATTPSTPCLPHERHTSDVSGYRTDLPASDAFPVAPSLAVFDHTVFEHAFIDPATKGALQHQAQRGHFSSTSSTHGGTRHSSSRHFTSPAAATAASPWRGEAPRALHGTGQRDQRGNQ